MVVVLLHSPVSIVNAEALGDARLSIEALR